MKPSKKTTTTPSSSTSPAESQSVSTGGYMAEADFDDTIAKNRVLPILDPASVPRPPMRVRKRSAIAARCGVARRTAPAGSRASHGDVLGGPEHLGARRRAREQAYLQAIGTRRPGRLS
jgi:hypothetical protein